MTATTRLNDTQLVILSTAASREDHLVLPLAKSLNLDDPASQKAIKALLKKNLVEEIAVSPDAPIWRTDDSGPKGLKITDAGIGALGLNEETDDMDGAPPADNAAKPKAPRKTTPKRAANGQKAAGVKTKADSVIATLKRKSGATLPDLMHATGWQAHSVRGFISGTLKKRMGLTVTSEKPANGERRYRIESA